MKRRGQAEKTKKRGRSDPHEQSGDKFKAKRAVIS